MNSRMAESQNIEWKESWRDEYLKWICGFANAQGGKIYIGTRDDGTVIGVSNSKKLLEDIPNKIKSTLGIVCDVNDLILEIASTDGNRLARAREHVDNKDNKSRQLIIPAKALNEFIKMSSYIDEETVKIYTEKTKLIIKSEKTMTISRILEGQFPKYNQLIPAESPKEAIVSVSQMITALERVAIMVNEKTSIVKLYLQ